MWNDKETSVDLLNFKVISDTAAQMILDAGNEPISIGISGSWGVGKSSLVQMIGRSLEEKKGDKKYLFIEFNAWLYQGYDDAKSALLNKVADVLQKEAKENQSAFDKVKKFIVRINWLNAAKFVAPVATGAIAGTAVAGPIGGLIGAITPMLSTAHKPSEEELTKLKSAFDEASPHLQGLLNDKEIKSIPREIEEIRSLFKDILCELDINLVMLVDDLDRCLPNTAISTLEAMRLLLFMERTAYIIAADEQMIRNAVRSHFGNIDLSDELVTSYFDKLIQIPIRVPRLGTNEVKGYLILLLADLAKRRGRITAEEMDAGQNKIIEALRKSWAGGLTKKIIDDSYGVAAVKLSSEIDIAEQIAPIMSGSDQIAGNPRLIKRFLNNLIIKESIAGAQGMSVHFDVLVKMQLFERCASTAAFEYLAKCVGDSETGQPTFIADIEAKVSKAEEYKMPDDSWDKSAFIKEWIKLSPLLGKTDLRPLLYLSRDKSVAFASYDELSSDGRDILEALCMAKHILEPLIERIKLLGEAEAEKIMIRMKRRARNQDWDHNVFVQIFHILRAYPSQCDQFINLLNEIPPQKRPVAIVPLLKPEVWAKALLETWKNDSRSPQTVINAIEPKRAK